MKIYVVLSAIMLTVSYASGDKITISIPCRNTTECRNMTIRLPNDAFCKDGYCMCPNADNGVSTCFTDMHAPNKTSGPLLYKQCTHAQDCNFEGGHCNTTSRQCACLKDYLPASNKLHCIKKIFSFDASCKDKNQCLAFSANSSCESNKCVCVPSYHYVDNACWKMAPYNESCTTDQECSHIEGAICINNTTCDCAAEMVLNEDGKKCLSAAKAIDDECTESVQCTATFEHSLCLDKMCKCDEDYHYEHNLSRCFPNKGIGDDCANNYECYQAEDYEKDPSIKSVICKANKCTCDDHYIRENDKCVSAGSMSMASLPIIMSVISLIYSIFFS
nr:PREDICTED: fibulin-2-like isoform X1 [Linepithema humile]